MTRGVTQSIVRYSIPTECAGLSHSCTLLAVEWNVVMMLRTL